MKTFLKKRQYLIGYQLSASIKLPQVQISYLSLATKNPNKKFHVVSDPAMSFIF